MAPWARTRDSRRSMCNQGDSRKVTKIMDQRGRNTPPNDCPIGHRLQVSPSGTGAGSRKAAPLMVLQENNGGVRVALVADCSRSASGPLEP